MGLLDLEVFERMLSERTKVVAFTHVSRTCWARSRPWPSYAGGRARPGR
jgi:hypothetical protein